jgi:hypothetical protein
MKTEKLESLVEIDEYNLDRELDRQPRNYMRIAIKLADARLAHAEAKAELDLTEAEVAKNVRVNPKKYGLDKITETGLEQVIKLRPEYQAAQTAMLKAKHVMDIYDAVREALEHKKYTLQGRVTLHVNNYHAKVKLPQGVPAAVQEIRKKSARKALRRREE